MRKKPVKLAPTTKKVLLVIGAGALIAGSLVLPGLPKIFLGKRFEDFDVDSFIGEEEWEPFDERRLRQKIKALYKAKLIKLHPINYDEYVLQVTEKGRRKLLKYNLQDLSIPQPDKWDGKWRIVTYDIPKESSRARDELRYTLKKLGFLQLQKSVYLYPHSCKDVIEFIREFYDVGENVTLLTVGQLENEEAYKDFFDI